jgi:hypothetical protein
MRRRRWGKRLGKAALATGIGLPLLAFGITNLFLLSPMGRTYVASRIQRTIQLETSVQGCTWSPWNGFTLHGLLVKQPAPLRKAISKPLLTAETIRIHPDWRALLKRKISIRGVEILKPDLSVPIELMSQISVQPALPPGMPALAAASQPQRDPALAANDIPGGTPPAIPQTDAAKGAAPKSHPSEGKAVPELRMPTVWITFTDARLEIVSAMLEKPLYRISRIDGGLPIGGRSAGSELAMSGISLLGNRIPEKVKVPVKWQAPVLSLGVIDGAISGISIRAEAQIALTPGIPFLIGAVLPEQEDREVAPSEAISARIGSMAGQGRFMGQLLAPGSWQGQAILQASSLDTVCAGQPAHFEHGQAIVIFQNGALRCVDARLAGEETTVMGNGAMLTDGRAAAIARIVAAPDTLLAISKFTQPTTSELQLSPLSTPQRAALDMQFFGQPGNFFYQPNPAAKPLLLK